MLEVRDLHKTFVGRRIFGRRRGLAVHAVQGVSLDIGTGEAYGLVGETGSGKTTVGRLILRLESPSQGSVRFQGEDFLSLRGRELRERRPRMQAIFQDSYQSLNPRLSVKKLIEEPLRVAKTPANERPHRVGELLEQVGLGPEIVDRLPHQLSGGQRQRVNIARALALEPALIICDEPVSALDVSIQAQILNLLCDIRARSGTAYLFISHDLAVVRHLTERVGIMYRGCIVEEAPTDEIFNAPMHPYTKALLAAVPEPQPTAERAKRAERRALVGARSDVAERGESGCAFHERCPLAQAGCATSVPPLREIVAGHRVACHLAEVSALQVYRGTLDMSSSA